jgi:hypothetical protein
VFCKYFYSPEPVALWWKQGFVSTLPAVTLERSGLFRPADAVGITESVRRMLHSLNLNFRERYGVLYPWWALQHFLVRG